MKGNYFTPILILMTGMIVFSMGMFDNNFIPVLIGVGVVLILLGGSLIIWSYSENRSLINRR